MKSITFMACRKFLVFINNHWVGSIHVSSKYKQTSYYSLTTMNVVFMEWSLDVTHSSSRHHTQEKVNQSWLSSCIFKLQINTSYPILSYPHIGIILHNQAYDLIYSCHNNSQTHSANTSLLGANEIVVCNL